MSTRRLRLLALVCPLVSILFATGAVAFQRSQLASCQQRLTSMRAEEKTLKARLAELQRLHPDQAESVHLHDDRCDHDH